MQMLPDSLGNLTELQRIDLSYCKILRMLPNSFGNLTKLQQIDLNNCRNLQILPNSFGNLKQLKFLRLAGCEQLTVSSETLGNITTLEGFSLSDSSRCFSAPKNIKVLPSQLTYQQSLQRLFLGFDFKELPTAIGNLSNLKVLSLASSCLEMLPPSFGDLRSLEELDLVYCPLKCFPDSTRMLTQLKKLRISCIKNLERLEIKECPSREVGGEIETATDSRGRGVLSKLDASEASYSNAVFPNLQHLHIDHCHRLVEVGALPTTLQTLDIEDCWAMEELPSMETLVSLEKLTTEECYMLKRIHGLGQLTKLKELYLLACYELEELPGVEHSRSLESVCARSCPKFPREYESLHRTCNYFFGF
jgi:Leucine-rich repeat (LRR) protein